MKKTLIVLLVLAGLTTRAQLMQGNSLINGGVGFAVLKANTEMKMPNIFASYEYMVRDNISVGLEVGYYAIAYNYGISIDITDDGGGTGGTSSVSTSLDYSIFYGYLMGNYYFLNDYKYNVYAGAKMGYGIVNAESNMEISDGEGGGITLQYKAPIPSTIFGVQIGGRYMFTEKLGAFLELGYGTTLIKGGLTLKLGY
ncbi:MAG: hypothetical protein GXO27_03915 [Chlorobi bacterium]|nr:hypothetical protein [Chlorobiota bacterium]